MDINSDHMDFYNIDCWCPKVRTTNDISKSWKEIQQWHLTQNKEAAIWRDW